MTMEAVDLCIPVSVPQYPCMKVMLSPKVKCGKGYFTMLNVSWLTIFPCLAFLSAMYYLQHTCEFVKCFQQELDKKKGEKKGQKKKVKSKSSQRKAAKKTNMPHGANDLTSKLYNTMEKHRDVSILLFVKEALCTLLHWFGCQCRHCVHDISDLTHKPSGCHTKLYHSTMEFEKHKYWFMTSFYQPLP